MPYPDHCPVVPSGGNQWKQPDPLLTYPSSIPYQRDHLGRLSLYCLLLVWCSEAASLTHPGHLRVSTSTVRHAVTGYQKPILYMSCRTCTPPHWSKPRQQLVILYRLARRQQWLKVKEHDTNSILNHRSVKKTPPRAPIPETCNHKRTNSVPLACNKILSTADRNI